MPPDRPPHSPDSLFVPPEALASGFEEVRIPETELHFIITDALNPFREALLAGGIPETDPSAAERKDIEINLEAILEADIASYRSTGPQGLVHWADALEALKDDLRMTPEKRAILEQEIKDGAIPIFMPGRDIQLNTTPEQYQQGFLPIWIKDSAAQTLADAYLWDHTAALIKSKDATLVKDVPDRPYILLAKPTAKVEARTTSKTVDQQKQELTKINKERASQGKPQAHAANPAGWGALVRRSAEITNTAAPQPLTTLVPIDDVNTSYCRFVELPLSSGGAVPDGYFGPDYRQLRFGRNDAAHAYPLGGFRLEVRVEI